MTGQPPSVIPGLTGDPAFFRPAARKAAGPRIKSGVTCIEIIDA